MILSLDTEKFYKALENILKMKLSEFIEKYRQVMPKYRVIDEDTNMSEIVKLFREDIPYLIIVDKKGRIRGVVSYIDFLHMFGRRKTTALSAPFSSVSRSLRRSRPSLSTFSQLLASDIAHSSPPHLSLDSTVEEAIQHMHASDQNYVILVSDTGEVEGVLTLHAIFRAVLREVGE